MRRKGYGIHQGDTDTTDLGRARRYQWAAVVVGAAGFLAYGPVIVVEGQAERLSWLAIAVPLEGLSIGLFMKPKRLYPEEDSSIRELVSQQGWRWHTTVLVAVLVALMILIGVAIAFGPADVQ